jgi:hypothetical protein
MTGDEASARDIGVKDFAGDPFSAVLVRTYRAEDTFTYAYVACEGCGEQSPHWSLPSLFTTVPLWWQREHVAERHGLAPGDWPCD